MNDFCLKRGRGLKAHLSGRHLDPPKRPLSSMRTLSRFSSSSTPPPRFLSLLPRLSLECLLERKKEGHNGVRALMVNFYQF